EMNQPKRNMELKCRCDDISAVKRRAETLGARDMGVLEQREDRGRTFETNWKRSSRKAEAMRGPGSRCNEESRRAEAKRHHKRPAVGAAHSPSKNSLGFSEI